MFFFRGYHINWNGTKECTASGSRLNMIIVRILEEGMEHREIVATIIQS